MDLYGTHLVVLSACESGIGDVQNGEGAFGLMPAFALAGAKHLVMSLWPVSDGITARQMKKFYEDFCDALHLQMHYGMLNLRQ